MFYVPPILPPTFNADGTLSDKARVPMEYLEYLFGPEVKTAIDTMQTEMSKRKDTGQSELMDLLIAKDWKSLFKIPDVKFS